MNQKSSIIRMLLGRLGAYLLAVSVAYLLGSLLATQWVVASLHGMGVTVAFADRMAMTLNDMAGMAGSYLPMVAFAFLIAFMITALLCRWLGKRRMPLYLLAGALALVTIHLALHLAFGITPVAVARTAGGLASQALAGAAGGFIYFRLLDRA